MGISKNIIELNYNYERWNYVTTETYKQSQLYQSPFSSSFPIFSCSLSILLMEEQALHGKVSLCVKITCRLLFDSVDSLPPLLN